MAVTLVRKQRSGCFEPLLVEEPKQRLHDLAGPSYGELVSLATMPWMSTILDVMMIPYVGGAISTYYIFLAGFVRLLPFWPKFLTLKFTMVLMAAVTYPPTLFRTVGRLAELSNIVVFVLFCMTVSIWLRAPGAAAARTSPVSAFGDLDKCGAVLCVCIYAFVWHSNCVVLSRELRDPTPIRCAAIALGATTLLCLVYALIALGGYWSWGQELRGTGSILDVYPVDDPLFVALRLALTASLLVGTIINVFPLRESCCGLVQKVSPGYKPSTIGHAGWSLGIIVFAAGTAILFPGVVKIITFLGGTFGPFMCMIFPVLGSRMVLRKGVWLFALISLVLIALFLNLNGLGLIGEAV